MLCSCCYNVFTVGDFYKHAGGTCSKHYEKVFIAETCSSLLSSMIQACNLPEESKFHRFNLIETSNEASDSYDDACMICSSDSYDDALGYLPPATSHPTIGNR